MKVWAATGDQLEDMPAPSATVSAPSEPLDIESLYADHAPFLARVVMRLLGDGPHVDDIIQETFLVAFKKRREFRGMASPRTWLYAIASNLCMRHERSSRRLSIFRRRLARATAAHDRERGSDRPDEQLSREQQRALVHEVLRGIPLAQREALVLYELEELEGKEVAEILGVPVATVWTRLHNGRKRFRDAMRRRLGKESVR